MTIPRSWQKWDCAREMPVRPCRRAIQVSLEDQYLQMYQPFIRCIIVGSAQVRSCAQVDDITRT